MATFCLVKKHADEFLKKIKNGEINPEKLSKMTSKERRVFFTKMFNEDVAKNVNALFESKLLLKNQKAGMITWAKRVGGITQDAKRDIISKINRLEKVLDPKAEQDFLEDLAAKKMGIDVSEKEAKNIFEFAKNVETKEKLINASSPIGSKERLEYGTERVMFLKYVDELKKEAGKLSFVEYFKNPKEVVYDLAGLSKSLLASMDNSFFGRQGIKVLYNKPTIWAKNFAKSWSDIGRELIKIDATDLIKADVYSRPNALNGKYKTMKVDVGILTEEAFPSSLPEKIPLLGRLFKGAEAAFNGGAMRMRADLADKYIKLAEKNGLDMLNKDEAVGVGKLINSMTGRGSIGKLETIGKEVNATFFSIKFFKSNFDTLTAHLLDKKMGAFEKKEARKNLLRIVGGVAGVLTTSELLQPGSTELDPRSANFGKIKIGNTRFDVTGGMASLISTASRLTPTLHNGEWGFWTKSSITGKYTKLGTGKYGERTALDVMEAFWENKLSPLAGVLRDVWRGKDFQGRQPTVKTLLKGATTPLPIQTFTELLNDPKSAPLIPAMLFEQIGFGVQTYGKPKKKLKKIKSIK